MKVTTPYTVVTETNLTEIGVLASFARSDNYLGMNLLMFSSNSLPDLNTTLSASSVLNQHAMGVEAAGNLWGPELAMDGLISSGMYINPKIHFIYFHAYIIDIVRIRI